MTGMNVRALSAWLSAIVFLAGSAATMAAAGGTEPSDLPRCGERGQPGCAAVAGA